MTAAGSRYDVAVAGSGIAGLSAGLTSARMGWKTLDDADILGGQLLSINHIDGYPGFPDGVAGYDLCPMAQEQASAAGAEFAATEITALEPADGGWRLRTRGGENPAARAVIVATGASLKTLDIPGEAEFLGKGVSHCASCDAPLLRDRVVGVIGGGDSAAQEALTLAESAARVIVFHRGEALSAQADYAHRIAAHPRIEARMNTVVEAILGGASVSGVRTRDRATGATADLDLAGVFIYIGLQSNIGFLADRIALDPSGRIPTDHALRTERAGIGAAGSVRSGFGGRAAIAAGEGAAAAITVDRYLRGGGWRDAAG